MKCDFALSSSVKNIKVFYMCSLYTIYVFITLNELSVYN